jgi:hypothetical protein
MACNSGHEYSACGPGESPTCEDARAATEADELVSAAPVNAYGVDNACVEGCYCPKGTVLNAGR